MVLCTCGHGGIKTDLILVDRQSRGWTWSRFQPYMETDKLLTWRDFVFPSVKGDFRTTWGLKWDGVGEAHSRVVWLTVPGLVKDCCCLPGLMGRSGVQQDLELGSKYGFCQQVREMAAFLSFRLFLTICLSYVFLFPVLMKIQALCNINKPI